MMTLTEREVITLLTDLGDGMLSRYVETRTMEQVNDIQRACGIHGDCHGMLNPSVEELLVEMNAQ